MSDASKEFREYENGVADVLASILGDKATVRRNVMLPSRTGGRKRQIDVLVEGDIFGGVATGFLIADCKLYKTRVDVGHVDRFIGMVEDVGAEVGLLVSSSGATSGAISRAQGARGVRVKTLSLEQLSAWRPAGTVYWNLEISPDDVVRVSSALRENGLRVKPGVAQSDGKITIEVFRHHGTDNPGGEVQQAQAELMTSTLEALGVQYHSPMHGIVFDGGTPAHRWLQVLMDGQPVTKVLVATEADIEVWLDRLSGGLPERRAMLTVERPEGWPFDNGFPF